MAKVTSKYQVTIPKSIAEQHGVKPGDDIEWSSSGDAIRITPRKNTRPSIAERLQRFDEATARLKRIQKDVRRTKGDRGWTREDLYENHGRSD